ncbi:MAG: MarR family transcriptional regulator [Deltaproteobacteria bacterium]|nr:MarR family transcriptional regulator [Deltaproteobacteria bacterium]
MVSNIKLTADNLTDCPYYLVSRVSLLVTSALKKALQEGGVEEVRPAYLGVLMSLWHQDGVKGVALAQRAGLEPSTMTELLDRMEGDQLVLRTKAPGDRRAQLIQLTDKGHKLQKPVLKVLDRALPQVFQGISKAEMALTKDVLRRILKNAQQGK